MQYDKSPGETVPFPNGYLVFKYWERIAVTQQEKRNITAGWKNNCYKDNDQEEYTYPIFVHSKIQILISKVIENRQQLLCKNNSKKQSQDNQ